MYQKFFVIFLTKDLKLYEISSPPTRFPLIIRKEFIFRLTLLPVILQLDSQLNALSLLIKSWKILVVTRGYEGRVIHPLPPSFNTRCRR